MNQELKIQAYLDNELPENEAREIANLLARDRDAVALLQALRTTRKALSRFETGTRVPETREFYWSKIRRQIEALEAAKEHVPVPKPVSVFTQLRRLLVPMAGLGILLFAGLIATRNVAWFGSRPASMETAIADTKAFTYRDYDAGATLVWLSYPADRDTSDDFDSEELY
jgi:hypothetical protein